MHAPGEQIQVEPRHLHLEVGVLRKQDSQAEKEGIRSHASQGQAMMTRAAVQLTAPERGDVTANSDQSA